MPKPIRNPDRRFQVTGVDPKTPKSGHPAQSSGTCRNDVLCRAIATTLFLVVGEARGRQDLGEFSGASARMTAPAQVCPSLSIQPTGRVVPSFGDYL